MCGESMLVERERIKLGEQGECVGKEREREREPKLGEQVCMKISLEHTRILGTWPYHRLPHGMILALHVTRTIMCICVTTN